MKVLVATTVGPYKVDPADPWESEAWLADAQAMMAVSEAVGIDVVFFAALETDGRGREHYAHLVDRLADIGGDVWFFSADTGGDFDSTSRLWRICTGRNLIVERALHDHEVTHVLFLDSDLRVPPESVVRLVELERMVAGGNVPSYCLDGPRVHTLDLPEKARGRDVRRHWNTAGFLLVSRIVFSEVRWGTSPDEGITDDPWFARAAKRAVGAETWVDHGLVGKHRVLVPVEQRGHDLEYRR